MLLILIPTFVSPLRGRKFLGEVGFQFRNDTGNATSSNGTHAGGSGAKTITGPPFKITTCDQVIQISAKTLLDYQDFTKKGDAFFTLSVYMVNMFESNNGDTLKNSITLDRIIKLPGIIPGSVSCVDFHDTTDKQFAICLPTKEEAKELIKAVNQFMKCRMGDSLKAAPARTVKSVMKASCLGLDVSFDLKQFGGDANKAKAALQSAMHKAMKNAAKDMHKAVKKDAEEKDPLAEVDSSPTEEATA